MFTSIFDLFSRGEGSQQDIYNGYDEDTSQYELIVTFVPTSAKSSLEMETTSYRLKCGKKNGTYLKYQRYTYTDLHDQWERYQGHTDVIGRGIVVVGDQKSQLVGIRRQ